MGTPPENTHHCGKYHCTYDWSPVWIVWIQLFQQVHTIQIATYFFCSVKFNLVKQETSLHLLLLGILKRNLPTSLPTYPPSYSPAYYKEKDNMNRNDDKNSFQVSREDVDIYQFSTTATTTS